jgi:methylenetetrahydrofolate dehydrogenase (NADP+) / methenyltetrahydrofolate cyclohydrolase
MSAEIIDGRRCADELKHGLAAAAAALRERDAAPGLATIAVGDDFSAGAYERRLARLAGEVEIAHERVSLAADSSQEEVVAQIRRLNADPAITGILVLRPLPPQMDEPEVFRAIDPAKDIEAVHPENAGLLALGVPRFVPSTAASAFHLLDAWLDSAGEDRADFYHRSLIVVVGRSNNVGKPCVSLGYDRQAAVASVDEWASITGRLGTITRRADVLIVAAGVPGLIRAEHVGSGAVVIDVGINPQTAPDGSVRMVGDVDFDSVAQWARAVTPVPGGVGPLTDVWLLRNTIVAARRAAGLEVPELDALPRAVVEAL